MDRIVELWRRLVFFFRRGRFHSELEEEMQHHVATKTQRHVEEGMSEKEAREPRCS